MICIFNCGMTVTDDDCRAVTYMSSEIIKKFLFCLRIEGTCRFIKNKKAGIGIETTSIGEFLPLADTYFMAIVEDSSHHIIILFWEFLDKHISSRFFGSLFDFSKLKFFLEIPEADIIGCAYLIFSKILEYHAYLLAVIFACIISNVFPIH